MDSEQILLERWRTLSGDRQREVLDFVEFIGQKSERDKSTVSKTSDTDEKVQRWLEWAGNHPKNSPNLPDEALHRDSMYD